MCRTESRVGRKAYPFFYFLKKELELYFDETPAPLQKLSFFTYNFPCHYFSKKV